MKKLVKITAFVLAMVMLVSLSACNKSSDANSSVSPENPQKLMDYVVDVGTINDLDENKAMEILGNKYHQRKEGCTCVVTQVDGNNLVGRNMDLSLTENTALKFVLDINKYKSIGIAYSHLTEQLRFESVLENGVDKTTMKYLPYVATDYLNDQGLYIQTNMRSYEEGYECSGTNPSSEVNLYLASLPAYLTSRCATVDEAVALAKEVNIYTSLSGISWNFGFTLADANGNYGLLEVAKNKVSFLPNQNGQTNYYVSEEFAKDAKYGQGYSRFKVVNEGLEDIKTQDQMLKQMEKVYYSQAYDYENFENSQFDVRSEFAGELPVNDKGEIDFENGSDSNSTAEWMSDDSRKDSVISALKIMTASYFSPYYNNGKYDWKKLREDCKSTDEFWVTAYSFAVDCKNKTMKAHFWEDTEQTFTFTF